MGLVALTVASFLGLVVFAATIDLPKDLLAQTAEHSARVLDRNGRLLRECRGASGTIAFWVPLREVPGGLKDALVAVEDKRFYRHWGVDPLSVVRATMQAVWTGRIVSGASTLTMQLARTLRPRPRTVTGKLYEAAFALRIEASLSKPQILEQYLNRIDFGPNLRGVGAVAQAYFNKPVAALSLAESALIAGLPQSPATYALNRHPERALKRQRTVLDAMVRVGKISINEGDVARREPLKNALSNKAFGAPHFVSSLLQGAFSRDIGGLSVGDIKSAAVLRTTIDPVVQRLTETAVLTSLDDLREHRVTAASAMVVDNASGDVLAYVGSPDFYNEPNQGQVDGVRAKRQPGSTLKPFVYAAAFEGLGYTAATVLSDLEVSFETEVGTYRPRNFDDKFRGPVRLREALGNSLNVPAVRTADALGSARLLAYLRRVGFDSLDQTPEYYGPALALGDGEVSLFELVRAYMTLARGGTALPLRVVTDVTDSRNVTKHAEKLRDERVIPFSVATVITDILKDKTARQSSFGTESVLSFDFDVAAKTGTSKGYRDNWVVGYTEKLTVGVWVGNFDGRPMNNVGGISGAAPIFRSIVQATHGEEFGSLGIPKWQDDEWLAFHYGLKRIEICPISGELRGPFCPHGLTEYVDSQAEFPSCRWHQEVVVDRRNGKLAGPTCPSNVVTKKRFIVFPEEYRAWAKGAERSVAPETYSPNCGASSVDENDDALRILYPSNNSRFVIDPERARNLQQIRLEVRARRTDEEIQLLVDGRVKGTYRLPQEPVWLLEEGQHQLQIANDRGEYSKPLTIRVRAFNESR
jgi:penicillin-binding protein 1C